MAAPTCAIKTPRRGCQWTLLSPYSMSNPSLTTLFPRTHHSKFSMKFLQDTAATMTGEVQADSGHNERYKLILQPSDWAKWISKLLHSHAWGQPSFFLWGPGEPPTSTMPHPTHFRTSMREALILEGSHHDIQCHHISICADRVFEHLLKHTCLCGFVWASI